MAAKQNPAKGHKVGRPHRGDIYLVNFDPTIGSEINKTRPALVIQNDVANYYSPITIVAAITSKFTDPPYPTEVILETRDGGLRLRSAALLNQIRSIDRKRLVKRVGRADSKSMKQVDMAIAISLGLTVL